MNNQNLVLLLVVVVAILLLFGGGLSEGYDSVTARTNELGRGMDDYYMWRAYGSNVYDRCRLLKYPYNYQPKPRPGRFDYYNPYFFDYGYGHL